MFFLFFNRSNLFLEFKKSDQKRKNDQSNDHISVHLLFEEHRSDHCTPKQPEPCVDLHSFSFQDPGGEARFKASWAAIGSTPTRRKFFCLPRAPRSNSTRLLGKLKTFARKATNAALASPSTGGALTFILHLSSWKSTISVRDERGTAFT